MRRRAATRPAAGVASGRDVCCHRYQALPATAKPPLAPEPAQPAPLAALAPFPASTPAPALAALAPAMRASHPGLLLHR